MKADCLKIMVLLLISLISTIEVVAQNGRRLHGNEEQSFKQKMIEYSQNIETLQAIFVQERTSDLIVETAISTGVLMFQSPSMLRWEYVEPLPSTLILNGSNAILLDRNNQRITGNERMLAQLGGVIVSMINGSGIAQNRQFSSVVYELDNQKMLVVLTPTQRQLRNVYNRIELKIDQNTMLASQIILNERSGDRTVILLDNKILNSEIPTSKFAIR